MRPSISRYNPQRSALAWLAALLVAAAPIEPLNPGPLWYLVLLDALRVTAMVAGAVVVFDALRSMTGRVPMHSGSPFQRDFKWLLVGMAAVVLGLGLVLSDRVTWFSRGTEASQVAIVVGWLLLSPAIVMRACTRSANGGLMAKAFCLLFIAALVAAYFQRGSV